MVSIAPDQREETVERTDAASPFDRTYALVTIVIVALVTITAFESMAVSTAMPKVALDLKMVRSYGLAFSVLLTTQMVGVVLAGVWTDRAGPLPGTYAGQILLAAGSLLCGLSHNSALFLVGRAVSGLGAGLLVVMLYVIVGRIYPEHLHPQVFSIVSAAWIGPSLLGPVLAGWLTEILSWRAVFWGVVIPIVLTLVMMLMRNDRLQAANDQVGSAERENGAHSKIAWLGVAVALAAGAIQWGTDTKGGHELHLEWSGRTSVAVLGIIGIAVFSPMLLPTGTWIMRRGLPAVNACRALMMACFFGSLTYVPLMLNNQRGMTLTQAGVILSVGSIGWALGAWWQGRYTSLSARRRLVEAAGVSLVIGLGLLAAVTFFQLPVWWCALSAAIAGLGQGLGIASTAVLSLAITPPKDHGEISAALQLSDALGTVLGIAGATTVWAVMHQAAHHDRVAYSWIFIGAAAVAALVIPGGRRVVPRGVN